MNTFPLLVLGTGQRCGSTLMQRLFVSHPNAFLWGENGGHLELMLDAAERLIDKSASLGGQAGRKDFESAGYQAFIANLIPPPEHVQQAFVEFVERIFRTADVWGFKEVRHDLGYAQRFSHFFPSVRVIGIIRDPRDILSSIDEWSTKGKWPFSATRELIDNWLKVGRSFLAPPSDLPVLMFRYEDYTADPQETVKQVAAFTRLAINGFDATVFDRRIHMHGSKGEGTRELRPFKELPANMRALLDTDEIRSVASTFGYDLP